MSDLLSADGLSENYITSISFILLSLLNKLIRPVNMNTDIIPILVLKPLGKSIGEVLVVFWIGD